MRVSNAINFFNPFSFQTKKAVQDFQKLTVLKKITTVALTILSTLASFFIFGLGGVAVFTTLVNRFTPKKNENVPASRTSDSLARESLNNNSPIALPDPKIETDPTPKEVLKSNHLDVISTDEENAAPEEPQEDDTSTNPGSQSLSLVKRWAYKIIPEVVPETKLALSVYRTGMALTKAVDSFQEGDTLGSLKQVAPVIVLGTGLMVGGPVVAAGFAAYKIITFGNLIAETAKAIYDVDQEYYASIEDSEACAEDYL